MQSQKFKLGTTENLEVRTFSDIYPGIANKEHGQKERTSISAGLTVANSLWKT